MAIKLEDIEIFSNSLGNNFGGGGTFGGASSGGGTKLTGIPNADYLQNLANLLQQQQEQGPQLGPDDFGSYTIPVSDPTYRSGFDYARSIAGGMPMEQVIAPGVSYSPEQPGGYTQADLNAMLGQTPPPPPPPPTGPTYKEGIEDMIRIPPSERGVTIPVDRKMPPLRDIFGGSPTQMPLPIPDYDIRDIDIDAIRQQIAESGIDFTNLFGLPKYETPDLSEFVRKEDIPSFIPDVPTGREFSIEDIRSGLDLPDFTQFARQEDIPTIPTFEQPDLSGFARLEDIPQIPTREDFLSIAREGIDIPQYQAPDLSAYDTRIAQLEQELAGLKQPTGGSFSISQPRPMGLF